MERRIAMDTRVVQSGNLSVIEMDGEISILNLVNNNYYNLDATGTVIWGMLKAPMRIVDIIEVLLKEYEVDEALCRQDVLAFLSRMMETDNITVV